MNTAPDEVQAGERPNGQNKPHSTLYLIYCKPSTTSKMEKEQETPCNKLVFNLHSWLMSFDF